MLQIGHQDQIEQLRDDEDHDGNAHRRLDVLAGIKTRRQHLDRDQPQQAGAVAHQGQRGLPDVAVGKGTVVVKRGNQRLGKRQQRSSAGNRQQHDNAQTPVQHGGIFGVIACRFGGRQLRHQHHANGDTQHGGRKFHQPVGIR